jgi:hypothetical protein
MSHAIQIFVGPKGLPTISEWQQAIDGLGFNVKLDPSVDPATHSGYWPAVFEDRETGFEFYLDTSKDVLRHYSHIKSKVGGSKFCASFVLHSDMLELGAASAAAAALTSLTNGVWFYADGDVLYDASEAIASARQDVKMVTGKP